MIGGISQSAAVVAADCRRLGLEHANGAPAPCGFVGFLWAHLTLRKDAVYDASGLWWRPRGGGSCRSTHPLFSQPPLAAATSFVPYYSNQQKGSADTPSHQQVYARDSLIESFPAPPQSPQLTHGRGPSLCNRSQSSLVLIFATRQPPLLFLNLYPALQHHSFSSISRQTPSPCPSERLAKEASLRA